MTAPGFDEKALERFREQFGLSQVLFVRLMNERGLKGVSPVMLHRWEKGRAMPNYISYDLFMEIVNSVGQRIRDGVRGRLPKNQITPAMEEAIASVKARNRGETIKRKGRPRRR